MLGNDHGHGNQIQRKLTEHSKTENPGEPPFNRVCSSFIQIFFDSRRDAAVLFWR